MMRLATVTLVCALAGMLAGATADEGPMTNKQSIRVGTFEQEVAKVYGNADGLPDEDVYSLVMIEQGKALTVYAGTAKGLARFSGTAWAPAPGFPEAPVAALAKAGSERFCWICEGALYDSDAIASPEKKPRAKLPEGLQVNCLAARDTDVFIGADKGLYRLDSTGFVPVEGLNSLLGEDKSVRAVAWCPEMVVAAKSGLFAAPEESGQPWTALEPLGADGRSWAPYDVRGVACDAQSRLWFASPQGVGCRDSDGNWTLYTGFDGLPYDDFTTVAAGGDGAVWFGTTMGAIRYDGQHWAYRQGRRWLPDDHVRAIAVTREGHAWFATRAGVGLIERCPMTLGLKARFYENEIDKYHRRTPYGYVLEARLKAPGDKSESTNHDSDNDGLWTSMYGAGECFAYAAKKDPLAKKRAKDAFEALRFLSVVTQGGDPPALPGFVARTILPTSGPNPNESAYTLEKDMQAKITGDALWKIIHPRWPTSADGKWYWKCDTSSDELDGHFFFYGLYYDLVAETEDEKARVREVVTSIADHLIEHDFCLVDWDGLPTRWAVFGPHELNHNPAWYAERGLNSMSILSYLAVAEHVSGDPKYRVAADTLINEHGYAINLLVPKQQTGAGSGNQSDDEMAFMSFYNLIRYTKDAMLRRLFLFSFYNYWTLEQPELNPFFNFVYAGAYTGEPYSDPWAVFDLSPKGPWIEQSLDTLKRFPIDLCNWRQTNGHRKDIVPLPDYVRESGAAGLGHRRNGLVLPVDERHFNHWNCDPWRLDQGGDGSGLSDGAVFLLPYYMGLYHGFIVEE